MKNLSITALAALFALAACAHQYLRDDSGWPAPPAATAAVYEGMTKQSLYVTMRDGNRIAVTVYLPDGLAADARIPAILRQTRYWRDWEFRFPFSLFLSDNHNGPTRQRFVEAGYAWVDVDVRGSGASTGRQQCSWCPDEVLDGGEILTWITQQPWSDGKVGAMGISYDGSAAEMLVLNHHPALKAVAPRFSNFDVWTDVAFPGGIHLAKFTKKWSDFNRAQDAVSVPDDLGFGAGLAVKGPRPVDADEDRSLLSGVRAEHAQNVDVHAEALNLTHRDDFAPSDPYRGRAPDLATEPTTLSGSIGVFSPHSYIGALESAGIPIFSISGWWDGAYQHAAIKRFLSVRTPGSRLVLGPWDHGGWQHVEPFLGSRSHEFDHDSLLLAFFDEHLRDAAPAANAKPVAYYTMGEGKWKFAETWPVPSTPVTYFASGGHALTAAPDSTGTDSYVVDNESRTGSHGRWFALLNLRMETIGYPERSEEDAGLLTYTSEPLAEDMEVTGHALVNIRVATTADDGFFFAYLEDVNEQGQVALITEGQLRALHRTLNAAAPAFKSPAPYRTYERKDAKGMTPGRPEDLTFDLLPVSYRFQKGHRVRLAIAGADKDHFAVFPGKPATWTVVHGATTLTLPVVR